MKKILSATVIFLFINSCLYSRNITFDDLYGLPSCGDPQVSPDGRQIIFGLHTSDPIQKIETDHLWIMNSDGSGQLQLTFGQSSEWQPRWTSDGNAVLFLSDREDGVQIWRLPMHAGEASKLTSVPMSVSEFVIYPGDNKIVLVSRVYPDCQTDSCNKARSDEAKENKDNAKLYDRLLFRHYSSWNDGRIKRIIIGSFDDNKSAPLFLNKYDAPTALLGGGSDLDISPDGMDICFSMTTDSMPAVWPNNDLWISTQSSGQPLQFTDGPGLEIDPSYSPNGKYLAYISTARAGYESDERDLIIYDRQKKTSINLTSKFNRSIGEYVWDPKSAYIYFTTVDRGLIKVFRLAIANSKVELLLGDAVYGDLRISSDGKFLILNRSLSDQPYELYRYDIENRNLTRLTYFTDKITSSLTMRRSEEFWFSGYSGDSVQGLITLPPDFDPGQKYPLAFLIHGGPEWCWLSDFNYYGWNTQLVAAQSYVVAQINPHGSAGYGLKFQEYVAGNWGKGDFDDLMTGLDYLLEHYQFIDSTRMGALGRSYGGFMTNWICGHTDRFRCLVSTDGTYNHISSYGSTEELWFPEWDYKGTPWTNREEYIRTSPATYAANFKTPTMVIHGQKDYRVDLSEGLQMFTTLQRMGIPSQLLYYPAQSHSAGGFDDLRTTYDEIFKWMALWLK